MESPPQPPIEAAVPFTAYPKSADSNLTVDQQIKPKSTTNVIVIKKKMKNKKKKTDVQKSHNISSDPPQQSLDSVPSSSSATSNLSHLRAKGIRISSNRRNPRIYSGPVTRSQKGSEADALALPLGMSIAAFVAQVLEKKDASGEKMSVDHLSEICTLAVKESLSNVFGDKFDCFINNFERSFQSTLMTLRVISESSGNRERSYLHGESSSTTNFNENNFHFNMKEYTTTNQDQATIVGLDEEHNLLKDTLYSELAVIQTDCIHPGLTGRQNGQNSKQLVHVPPNRLHSSGVDRSMLTTLEKSVTEQARSNDLKAVELSLSMRKIKLKEAQIAVNCDSNILERWKLKMGISKANFRAEKFRTELEETRYGQLLKKCVDCLVAGLLIMLICLAYGTYVHSHQRLIEATESCMPLKESGSWWIPKPMSSFSSGLQILRCKALVLSRMLFGGFMIVALTYSLILRSSSTNQTMPITFILLLLGLGCGLAGKLCIDTLGGSGAHWLIYWELLCLVHFFSNIWTSMLFRILHGPVTVVDRSTGDKLFPYWLRRVVFYAVLLVYLPLLCGLMPFAGPGEWVEHFVFLVVNRMTE